MRAICSQHDSLLRGLPTWEWGAESEYSGSQRDIEKPRPGDMLWMMPCQQGPADLHEGWCHTCATPCRWWHSPEGRRASHNFLLRRPHLQPVISLNEEYVRMFNGYPNPQANGLRTARQAS